MIRTTFQKGNQKETNQLVSKIHLNNNNSDARFIGNDPESKNGNSVLKSCSRGISSRGMACPSHFTHET
jgi:hypothetical protein